MNPIVKLAASALPGEKKYILFVGAGVSKDAGIPTAWDLMLKTAALLYASDNPGSAPPKDIGAWFEKSQYAQMTYPELIGGIFSNYPDQQSFMEEQLGRHPHGEAHRLIAEMARRGIIRAIVTTNFDTCLEKALEEKGVELQILSNDKDVEDSEPLIHCKKLRIYKPHGTLGHGAIRNTPRDLEQLSPEMERQLTQVLGEHGVIILGYAGADKGIQRVLQARNHFRYPLFWVNPQPPNETIDAFLKQRGHTYIACTGASAFLKSYFQLLDRLNELAPDSVKGPTISDIEVAFRTGDQAIGALYDDYLDALFNDLKRTQPDFSQYEEYDDAVYSQVEAGMSLTARICECALLAGKNDRSEASESIYKFFGKCLGIQPKTYIVFSD